LLKPFYNIVRPARPYDTQAEQKAGSAMFLGSVTPLRNFAD
jgi:hypothetical protein